MAQPQQISLWQASSSCCSYCSCCGWHMLPVMLTSGGSGLWSLHCTCYAYCCCLAEGMYEWLLGSCPCIAIGGCVPTSNHVYTQCMCPLAPCLKPVHVQAHTVWHRVLYWLEHAWGSPMQSCMKSSEGLVSSADCARELSFSNRPIEAGSSASGGHAQCQQWDVHTP